MVAAAVVEVVADYGGIAAVIVIVADIQAAAVGTDTARTAAAAAEEETGAAGEVGAGRSARDSRTVDSRTAAAVAVASNLDMVVVVVAEEEGDTALGTSRAAAPSTYTDPIRCEQGTRGRCRNCTLRI